MIILGIDTAIRCTGYGVIDMRSLNDMSILDCGVIKNKPKMLHSECLRRIAGGIRELIDSYSPDVASIENVFMSRNVKTAMILSMARGAAIATLADMGISVHAYSPKSAKRSAVGNGQASKQQVATMIASIFSIDIAEIPDDSTDALALAMCHGQIAMRPELNEIMSKPI